MNKYKLFISRLMFLPALIAWVFFVPAFRLANKLTTHLDWYPSESWGWMGVKVVDLKALRARLGAFE